MQYQYQIAGISILVDAPIEIRDNEAFALYRVSVQEKTDYTIKLVSDASLPRIEGRLVFENEMNRIYKQGGSCLHLFHIPFSRGVAAWDWITEEDRKVLHYQPGAEEYFQSSTGCFNAAGMERILFQTEKYLFHCSYVEYQGRALLFSAPSGGGKTTQGMLWEKYTGARMLNGDRTVLEKTETGYLCHGLPIAGSSGVFINRSNPLCAVFVVKKAQHNRVYALEPDKAFEAVFSELTMNLWNEAFKIGAVDFAMQLVNQIPVYCLECRMDEGAVLAVKEVIDSL